MKISSAHIKPIKTKKDYKAALKLIEDNWDCAPKTNEADLLEVLAILVDEYEQKHFPISAPDPVEAIKYRMEQLGLSQKDLAKYVGGANRASEILNRKRTLTLNMIKSLCKHMNIPPRVLMG